MAGVVFAFFGLPGAGKTTLCRRFGELTGVPAIDTDVFLTPEEREAAEADRYTVAMRMANIARYAEHIQGLLHGSSAVAMADILPNRQARVFLQEQLAGVEVVFVLVETPRALWEQRLAARDGNAVKVGLAGAETYIRDHWEGIDASTEYERVENGNDTSKTDAALLAIYERFALSGRANSI